MTVLLAIAVTAIVVATGTALAVRHAVRARFITAIGGRDGSDPIEEHRHMLAAAKRDVAAASARADLLKLALDGLTAGVIVTDHDAKVLVRSRLANDTSPRSHEQTLVDATTTELLAMAVQGRAVEREVEVFGPPPRTLFVHAVPITASARVVGALAVIDDVTDHHRIEKTRRDFVANLSHELRTPVGAISLLAEMLVGEQDPETRDQLTKRVVIETDRMAATVDSLLELSRIESEAQRYDETVVVQEVVNDAVARVRVSAEASKVDVGVIGPTDPITLTGNRGQLLIALVNLVENAVKYSSPGDSVSVRSRVDDDLLSLVVQDTGRGIPARDVDRVFERFYRVDRSRDVGTGGTGIGLSIVRHVALNHGGSVHVESFEGDGSTFTMALPFTVSSSAAPTDAVDTSTTSEMH